MSEWNGYVPRRVIVWMMSPLYYKKEVCNSLCLLSFSLIHHANPILSLRLEHTEEGIGYLRRVENWWQKERGWVTQSEVHPWFWLYSIYGMQWTTHKYHPHQRKFFQIWNECDKVSSPLEVLQKCKKAWKRLIVREINRKSAYRIV